MPEVLRARPDVPVDLGPCSSACSVDQLYQRHRPRSDGPQGRPALPIDSPLGPWANGVNQFSQVTRAWAEGPWG